MDFAKKQLEKYGWKEGEGLGKNSQGITVPLRPKLKSDKASIGYEYGEEFTFKWWEHAYNQASGNISVKTDTKTGELDIVRESEFDIKTCQFKRMKKKRKCGEEESSYDNFERVSVLTVEGETKDDHTQESPIEENPPPPPPITDEELFAKCGGRTAHKGARHGLKLNGKLARLEEQEKLLLASFKSSVEATDSHKKKKHKKQDERI